MALLDFARGLVGTTHEAVPVTMAVDPDDRAAGRVPTEGDPLQAVVIDMPGNEARSLGLEVPQRLRRIFLDPGTDGVPLNIPTESQIRVRGETVNVLSSQRIDGGSMRGTIVIGQVLNA